MSRFRFEIPTETQALDLLLLDTRQAEFYGDRVTANRRLMAVTTPAERAAVQALVLPRENLMGCASCGKHLFVRPTICWWCQRDMRNL